MMGQMDGETATIFYFFIHSTACCPVTTIFGLPLFAFRCFPFVNYTIHQPPARALLPPPSISTNSQWKPNYTRISITQCLSKASTRAGNLFRIRPARRLTLLSILLINYSTFALGWMGTQRWMEAGLCTTFEWHSFVAEFFMRMAIALTELVFARNRELHKGIFGVAHIYNSTLHCERSHIITEFH